MIPGWFERVGSCVPRGFSRYYIIELLKEEPRTGKEIIDSAAEQSGGIWKPSPGLVYPLLGRLLDEGLVEESDGRYAITESGRSTAADVDHIGDIVRRQLEVLFRLGGAGRFVAMDLLERISMIGSVLSSNASSMTEEETDRYRKFLESELEKVGHRIDVEKS
ncbi:MAG: PadR family transcriptional regulator [Nitrosopumilus sp. H8]|nr:MAG: PadR family transcriptional regulator [Nitrosopumilus sp. H13]RNJ78430.1 MAG: PadR family transcriptional regulator [Nitrosopumilus sp. H8]